MMKTPTKNNSTEEDLHSKAQSIALRFLSYRLRSEKEVRDKLLDKGFSPEIIEIIIQNLTKARLIDDEVFASWWIDQRKTFRQKSSYVIKQELRQKGIDEEIIEENFEDESDTNQAMELINKKLYKFDSLPYFEKRQKIGAFLQNKGFSYDTIHTVFKKLGLDH